MTDTEVPNWLQKARESLAAKAAAAAATQQVEDEWAAYAPELELGPGGVSSAANMVNAAWDSITTRDIYDRLNPKARYAPGHERRTGGEVLISCPLPGHEDKRPSCSLNLDTGKWHCHKCADDGHKVEMAEALGVVGNFFEVKKQVAKRLRGVDYEALRTAEAPTPVAPPMPEPVAAVASTAPAAPTAPAEDEREQLIAKQVEYELIRLEARDRATKIRQGETHVPLEEGFRLDDWLSEPDDETEWTIDGLHQYGNSTTIRAQNKTGKSTLMRELLRSLADGKPFLGSHEVRPIEGRIAYFNLEIPDNIFRRDVRDLGIVNTSKVVIHNMKGRRWRVTDDSTFAETVDALKRNEIEVLIIDPYADALEGDADKVEAVNPFIQRLDQLKFEAGVVDLFMPVHLGKDQTAGARGSSRIDDWPDTLWTITRDQFGARYFRADGRRVTQEAKQLVLDDTQRLAYGGANSSVNSDKTDALFMVAQWVKDNPGKGVNEIKAGMDGIYEKRYVGELLKELRATGQLRWEKQGQTVLHWHSSVPK